MQWCIYNKLNKTITLWLLNRHIFFFFQPLYKGYAFETKIYFHPRYNLAIYGIGEFNWKHLLSIAFKFKRPQIKASVIMCGCAVSVRLGQTVVDEYDAHRDIQTQYAKLAEQKAENFDIFYETAKKLYPDYIPEIEMIEKGSVPYLCNMFVMKKEHFFEYNKFCFSILQAVDEQIDHTNMSVVAARFLGYLGNFYFQSLFFIFISAKMFAYNKFYLLKQENNMVKKSSVPPSEPKKTLIKKN